MEYELVAKCAQHGSIPREHRGTSAAGAAQTPKASFIPAQGDALGLVTINNPER